MASWKIGPALAAGNTIVMKAAEQTPLSILYLANLFTEAGFPPGVVNIINGYGRTAGAALAGHMDVDKIAFTGSTATGKEIMKAASNNLKNITVETGGKSPLIVFEDAKLDAAVKYGHYGIMGNSGQICTANSRIFVHENVYDKFIELFKEKTLATSIIGNPFDEQTFQGPQVSKAQHERILSYIQSAKDEGAKLELGGEDGSKDFGGKGYYIKPTIFSNVDEDMTVYKEEIFGPFAVIKSFKTDEEAIRMANDTSYGLAASLFTENITRAHKVSRKLEAGSKFLSLIIWDLNFTNDDQWFGLIVAMVPTSEYHSVVSSNLALVVSVANWESRHIPTTSQSCFSWIIRLLVAGTFLDQFVAP